MNESVGRQEGLSVAPGPYTFGDDSDVRPADIYDETHRLEIAAEIARKSRLPSCGYCGSSTIPAGSCHVCTSCGTTTGCS